MPAVRARLVTVLEKMQDQLIADAQRAGSGNVVSIAEAAGLSGVLKDAEEGARMRQGRGGRVTASELSVSAMQLVTDHIGQINQRSGAGALVLSQEEIKRLQGVNPDTAKRAAKAYELITGKRVVLDGAVPASPATALPERARIALVDQLVDYFGMARAARVDIAGVTPKDGGFEFSVKTNVFEGSLFAREVDGRFLLASKPFDAAMIRLVAEKALAFFDDEFKGEMEQWGASAAEIADARRQFVPDRLFLAGESDPWSYTNDYPFVVSIDNQTGSDHGIYAGVNPATGEVDIYSFN